MGYFATNFVKIRFMKKFILISVLIAAALLAGFVYFIYQKSQKGQPRVWSIKSIDTMKYSRDLAQEKLNDPPFDQTIDLHVQKIKETGATHVAIATPYDEKFYPYLARWVTAARKYNLNIWYRGNFSRWEGWFGEKRDLTRDEHIELTKQFIRNHPELFIDDDAFSPCPECENGGEGDPRHDTGRPPGFKNFLVQEYKASNEEFKKLGKNVTILFPVNYDVANLIFDDETADSMGNLITIDHYVKDPRKFADDINDLARKADAQIMIGEFGAPIPDIHGEFSDQQQASWLRECLSLIAHQEEVIGLSWWVSFGGSTAVFNEDGSPRPAVSVLKEYYSLAELPR